MIGSCSTIASQLVGVWRLVSYAVELVEYQQAGSGYIAYCGVYVVDEEKRTVTHIPSVALVPNLILKEQLRSIILSGDRLSLYAVIPVADSGPATSRPEWRHAGTCR